MDKTFDLTIKVRVTTMNGWKPERDDIEGWLDGGGTLELVSVEKCEEAKQA